MHEQQERYYLALGAKPDTFHIMDRTTNDIAFYAGLFAGPDGNKWQMTDLPQVAARNYFKRKENICR